MNPKVSILVPVFKTSAFIEKCAVSLFNQTFDDIEYIFVNDATPDDSIEKLEKIISKFPNRNNQVTIIHHNTNRGLASARNTALNASKGDYISVVDSDDYIESEMIQILYNKIIEDNADVVVSNLIIEYEDKSAVFNDTIYDNSNDNFLSMILHKNTSSSLCNKLIKSNLYKRLDCRVPENLNYCEDWFVMTRVYYYAKKIAKTEQAFYHYSQHNSNSITKEINRMHFENVILFWDLLDSFLIEHNEYERYKDIIALPKVQSKVNLMVDTHSKKLRKEFADIFRTEETQCFQQLRFGEKLMLLFIRFRLFGVAQLFHNLLVYKNKTV
jgi:glycosyltransferase involved in cell wall biosynthesis